MRIVIRDDVLISTIEDSSALVEPGKNTEVIDIEDADLDTYLADNNITKIDDDIVL